MAIPQRGEIWVVDLNPAAGREQQGSRPVLVLSPVEFNRSRLALVCAITQGGERERFAGLVVSLMGAATATQGVVMSNQLRTIDMVARKGRFVEKVPEFVLDEVLAKVQTFLQ
jgi:mRNA interferase ChpB